MSLSMPEEPVGVRELENNPKCTPTHRILAGYVQEASTKGVTFSGKGMKEDQGCG